MARSARHANVPAEKCDTAPEYAFCAMLDEAGSVREAGTLDELERAFVEQKIVSLIELVGLDEDRCATSAERLRNGSALR